jgi:hypothetical protein
MHISLFFLCVSSLEKAVAQPMVELMPAPKVMTSTDLMPMVAVAELTLMHSPTTNLVLAVAAVELALMVAATTHLTLRKGTEAERKSCSGKKNEVVHSITKLPTPPQPVKAGGSVVVLKEKLLLPQSSYVFPPLWPASRFLEAKAGSKTPTKGGLNLLVMSFGIH